MAGERIKENYEVVDEKGMIGFTVFVIVAVLVIGALSLIIYMLWRKVHKLEEMMYLMKDDQQVDGMMIGAYHHELKTNVARVENYAKKIHRGLIKASGYVDDIEFQEGDWKNWHYLEWSNRDFDMRRVNGQVQTYLKTSVAMRAPSEDSAEDELPGGETATVQLEKRRSWKSL